MNVKVDRRGNSGFPLPRDFSGEHSRGQDELAILAGLEFQRSDNPGQDFSWGIQPSSIDINHLASLQTGVVNSNFGISEFFSGDSTGRIISDVSQGAVPINSTPGTIFDRNLSNFSSAAPALAVGGSVGNLLDQVTGLKPELGFGLDWTFREQLILEEALIKYADESKFKKYIKIAALLPEKTVRDVALRCQWMSRNENAKRRKPEEYLTWKRIKDKKDNVRDSAFSSRKSASFCQPDNSFYSLVTPMVNLDKYSRNEGCSFDRHFAIDGPTFRLLEENIKFFNQIEHNLENLKVQDNINLFCLSKNNISSMINRMMDTPGVMSQMPPLPVAIHEELANTILFGTTQARMFEGPIGT